MNARLRRQKMKNSIIVCGAGLAGCEAAWQAAERGVFVRLFEMKPVKFTPAHRSPGFAELVCSNSLRSESLANAVGLLKEEMRRLGSLIIRAANATRIPAGSALAVDRVLFSEYITNVIKNHPNIEIISQEVTSVPEDCITLIATGPLTSDALADYIETELGCEGLHFFDAAAPIVAADSIDMSIAFFGSRYGKGGDDYINCPMTKEQYDSFYEALVAQSRPNQEFDREQQEKAVTLRLYAG